LIGEMRFAGRERFGEGVRTRRKADREAVDGHLGVVEFVVHASVSSADPDGCGAPDGKRGKAEAEAEAEAEEVGVKL
jgi:hypothetical protein